MTVGRAEHVVERHWRVCPACAEARAEALERNPALRPALGAAETLATVDAAVEGRCAGPGCGQVLTERSASAYWCSADCQAVWTRQRAGRPSPGSPPVRGSTGVAQDAARWRPDLVTAFDDTGWTLLDRTRRDDTGLTYCVFTDPESDRGFLRVDDGHRFVGLEVPWSELERTGPSEAFRRLERELRDRRRLDPEPEPASPWLDALRRMGEAFDREVLGDRAGPARLPTVAERAASYAELAAAGTLLWMPDPPADPEAPTMAELAGGIDLGDATLRGNRSVLPRALEPREPLREGDRITVHWSNPGADQAEVTEVVVEGVEPDGTAVTSPVDRSGWVTALERVGPQPTGGTP